MRGEGVQGIGCGRVMISANNLDMGGFGSVVIRSISNLDYRHIPCY